MAIDSKLRSAFLKVVMGWMSRSQGLALMKAWAGDDRKAFTSLLQDFVLMMTAEWDSRHPRVKPLKKKAAE